MKLVLLMAFVISLALLRSPSRTQFAACFLILLATAWMAKLPILRLLAASLWVVPFVGLFSLVVYFSGDRQRGLVMLAKSYLSALGVLVTISSTPLPQVLSAARFFDLPSLLIDVMQLIYRYMFVLSTQAQAMRAAFLGRGGRPGRRALQASSGMVAVLFSRSYEKAAAIHNAMLARSFSGRFGGCDSRRMNTAEAAILMGGLAIVVGLHFI